LAFEKGYNAIGEAYPFDINKWSKLNWTPIR
jgi:hypothetical protein